MYEKLYVHEKIVRTRNCRRRFIKHLLSKKVLGLVNNLSQGQFKKPINNRFYMCFVNPSTVSNVDELTIAS